MKLFGFEITRAPRSVQRTYTPVASSSWLGPYFGPINEPFTGAWQQNMGIPSDHPTLLQSSAVYMCVSGIASDIAKMRLKLSEEDSNGIWKEIRENSPYLSVLRKPNHFQNHISFIESWVLSKLLHGNTYVLKEREPIRGLVKALYILNPKQVVPLVAEDGSVYYELHRDDLSKVEDSVTVPASEIIHDRMNTLWHPLVGVSPLYACATSAAMQARMESNSSTFFTNHSMPGGVITVPDEISDKDAAQLKREFDTNFGGVNRGRVLVIGNGMTFTATRMTAEQSQLAELLGFTVEDVGRAFHYPLYKLTGKTPPYAGGIEIITTGYYTDCLQVLIESLEACLDEGLELRPGLGVEMDLDNLLRMDTKGMMESLEKFVGSGIGKIDEARNKLNLPPVTGGDTPYLQQQNYSLSALAKRDSKEDPFASATPAPTPAPEMPEPDEMPKPEPETVRTVDLLAAEMLIYEALQQEEVLAG